MSGIAVAFLNMLVKRIRLHDNSRKAFKSPFFKGEKMERVQELNAYAIVLHNNKILILKRGNGIWEFPGGGVDWGEHPNETVVREVKEETGLVVSNPAFVGITSATYEKDGKEKHAIYLVYKCDSASDGVTLCGEHVEYRWLLPNELKFLKLGLNAEAALQFL